MVYRVIQETTRRCSQLAVSVAGITLLLGLILSALIVRRQRVEMHEDFLRISRNLVATFRADALQPLESPRLREAERPASQIEAAVSLHSLVEWAAIIKVSPTKPPELIYCSDSPKSWTNEDFLKSHLSPRIETIHGLSKTELIGGYQTNKGKYLLACGNVRGDRDGNHYLALISADWNALGAQTLRYAWPPVALVLLIFSILMFWCFTRSRFDPANYRRIDSGLAIVIGGLLTLFAVAEIRSHHRFRDRRDFNYTAELKEQGVIQDLFAISELGTKSIESFAVGSTRVDAHEFSEFTRHLSYLDSVIGWAWVSRMPAKNRALYESQVLPEPSRSRFSIWELSDQGVQKAAEQRANYFPVMVAAPGEIAPFVLGYDLGSNAKFLDAIQRARYEKRPVATSLIHQIHPLLADDGILVVHPVTRLPKERFAGFVVAAVSLDRLLERSMHRDWPVVTDLFQVGAGGKLEFLASTAKGEQPPIRNQGDESLRPILAFGNTYALRTRPRNRTDETPYLRPDWMGGLSGVLLTTAAFFLVRAHARRRDSLESAVADRTQDLERSAKRYHDLAVQSRTMAWEVDHEGRYVFVSNVVFDMLHYESEELIGEMCLWDIHPEDERHTFRAAFSKYLRVGGELHDYERKVLTKTGESLWVSSTAAAIYNRLGELTGYRGWDSDINQRKHADDRMHLLGAALDAAAHSVIITDKQGKIQWINESFIQISGYTLAEASGRAPGELLSSGVHDQAFYQHMWQTIGAGEVWCNEMMNRSKDGTVSPELVTITPIKDEVGEIQHFIAIKQDLTGEKIREQQLFRTQRLQSIGTLAGGIAHDLNNALSPIMMAVDLMKIARSDSERAELLELIEKSAQRGAGMVRQVLAFAKGTDSHRGTVNLSYIAGEIDALVRETFPKEISWKVIPEKKLWAVQADATQMHQVLLNLCVNARDAMPHGGTLVLRLMNVDIDETHARTMGGYPAGRYVKISVKDSGVGMSGDLIEHIFDPFFSTKESGKGTGLGLATTHSIVKNHGGFVLVQSSIDEGSCFEVYLPAGSSDADESVESLGTELRCGNGEGILVIDDDPRILSTLSHLLKVQNYRVYKAVNGAEGVAVFAEHGHDIKLVVTDISMPVMDGPAAAVAIRTIDPNVCIIGSSGQSSMEEVMPLARGAFNLFVQKPYNADQILHLIWEALKPFRQTQGASGEASTSAIFRRIDSAE